MLTLRTLTNIGDALSSPSGTVLPNVKISFTLVASSKTKLDVWDAVTHERVGGRNVATTDENGEFSLDLWPNSRGNVESYYLCGVNNYDFADFIGQIPVGVGSYTWIEFFTAGTPVTPQELSALELHKVDPTAHGLTEDISNALSGASLPDSSNPFATIADVSAGGAKDLYIDESFTPADDQTEFILSSVPISNAKIWFIVNNIVYLVGQDFTISGITITWLNSFTLQVTDAVIIRYANS